MKQNSTAKPMTDKEQQFEQLVHEHKGTIYRVCYMFSKGDRDVDDLFQEVLIRLWMGFDTFRHESNPRTWVYRVCLNTCLNLEKKNKRGISSLTLELDFDPVAEDADDAKQMQMLHDRIARLDMLDRALVLLWLEDISYDEIGAILGISTKNVSVRLVRVKEKLVKMTKETE